MVSFEKVKKLFIFLIIFSWNIIFWIKFSSNFEENKRLSQLYTLLQKELFKEIKKFKFENKVSLVVKDLRNPFFKVYFRENVCVPAASLIKLPVVCAVFKAFLEGKINLEEKYLVRKKDISWGSGVLKKFKLPYEVTYKKLIELSITESDNTATNILIKRVGFKFINQAFKEWGLKNSKLNKLILSNAKKGNFTSASDISQLLSLIYYKKILTPQICKKIIHLLINQKINDRLPKYLPKTVIVAHKTGLEKGALHDAGIVFLPQREYLICILTQKNKNYKRAKEFIAHISKVVFKEYEKFF